jgi:hypothetical protein
VIGAALRMTIVQIAENCKQVLGGQGRFSGLQPPYPFEQVRQVKQAGGRKGGQGDSYPMIAVLAARRINVEKPGSQACNPLECPL